MTSTSTRSSLPTLDLRTRKGKQRFSAWLRDNIHSLNDLLDWPGFRQWKVKNAANPARMTLLNDFLRTRFGEDAVVKLRSYMRRSAKRQQKMKELLDGKFVMETDTSRAFSKVAIIPKDNVFSQIVVFMRNAGLTPQQVGKMVNITADEVDMIATPHAMAQVSLSAMRRELRRIAADSLLVDLAMVAMMPDKLKLSDKIALARLFISWQKEESEIGKDRDKRPETEADAERRKLIADRVQRFKDVRAKAVDAEIIEETNSANSDDGSVHPNGKPEGASQTVDAVRDKRLGSVGVQNPRGDEGTDGTGGHPDPVPDK